MFSNIYRGKKVLVTGHTGFKGSWLCVWLKQLGAEVYGISKDIPTTPSLFGAAGLENQIHHSFLDIRDFEALEAHIRKIKPDITFHLAAEAIVKTCFENPRDAFTTNSLGTVNMLEVFRKMASPQTAVFITSDKCYENVEWDQGYKESDRLGGKDPYSASKASAEIAFSSYFRSYFSVNGSFLATARAGNVIGGGDWAANRIVPDAITAWAKKSELEIRSPESTRPWQHVLEPLSGYLLLGQRLLEKTASINGESFNFGPETENNHTVLELIQKLQGRWKDTKYFINKPKENRAEAKLLKLNIEKALKHLKWFPALDFEGVVAYTADWYRSYYEENPKNIFELTSRQITAYETTAKEKGLCWTK